MFDCSSLFDYVEQPFRLQYQQVQPKCSTVRLIGGRIARRNPPALAIFFNNKSNSRTNARNGSVRGVSCIRLPPDQVEQSRTFSETTNELDRGPDRRPLNVAQRDCALAQPWAPGGAALLTPPGDKASIEWRVERCQNSNE